MKNLYQVLYMLHTLILLKVFQCELAISIINLLEKRKMKVVNKLTKWK